MTVSIVPSSQQKIVNDDKICDGVWFLFFESLATIANNIPGGTVTSFSFNNANGFTGSVSNPATTPQLTLTLDTVDGGVTTIKVRRDTAANWTSVNPILASGEAGYETNTGKLKYGDGVTAWNSLAYFAPQTITLTGDVTGSGTGTFATTIKNDVALAGNPTTTTQSISNDSTRIATTAFVKDVAEGYYHETGVRYGGVGTVQGGLGVGTTMNITAGAGFIMNNSTSTPTFTPVTWNASNNVSLISTAVQYIYWYIDSSGTLTQTTTPPDRSSFRTKIWLFRTSYTGGAITGIGAFPVPIDQTAPALKDLNSALGPIRISGAAPTFSGANLKLKITLGEVYDYGTNLGVSLTDPNVATIPTFDSGISSTFRYATTSGTILSDVTNIDPANYQVAGVVTAIPGASTRTTIQYVLGFQGGLVRVLYGNAFYTSTAEALAALQVNNPYDCAPSAFTYQNSVVLGAIITTKGTTDLSTQATFVTTNKFFAFGNGSSSSIGGAFMLTDLSNGSFSSANLASALTDETGSGANVFANSPTLVTPDIGAATATSINFGGTTLSNYVQGTWTPTVTLVGGAGNTVPQYSVNSGRYTRIGNMVFARVELSGDGGNEGAGTGQITMALPIAISASATTTTSQIGIFTNGTTLSPLIADFVSSGTTIALYKFTSISAVATFTGANQNNTSRKIELNFNYEV